MRRAAVTLWLVSLLGCTRVGASGEIVPTPTLIPSPTPAPEANTPVVDMPTLAEALERPLYVLNVTLDYAAGRVHTQQRLEFANPADRAIQTVRLSLPPARRANAVQVHSVRLFGAPELLRYTLADAVLEVELPQPLEVGKAIALSLDFTLNVPPQEIVAGIGGDDTSRGPNSLTCGHWYALLVPFRNGNWDTPAYAPIGDPYLSELADYEVSILAPEGVIVAAGGEEARAGRLWRYSLPKARVFAFSASDRYIVERAERDGVEFVHYAYPEHRAFAEDVLITAERAVALFSRLYGPYPYRALRIAETDRPQGQEYSGLIGIGSRLYQGYPGYGARHDLIATTVHETAHQWWFNVVGNDQIRSPWLDESLARYGELRFYQEYYPRDVEWWFNYFIIGKDGAVLRGAIDLGITDYRDGREYVIAVYRRGLLFMRDLRNRIGGATLDAALREYYRRGQDRVADQDLFFDAIASQTTQDISDLVRGYFAQPVRLPCRISKGAPSCRP
ncbi:MAG: M1 family metallopeptidase [Thermoflexales bacterium]|nr:M1 family metallopeptidase [Thermoflexales bacterium]